MQVTQEQVSPCEVELQIEIDADKVNSAVDETYKDLARVTSVPGFRKGKAPRAILARYVGEENVKDRAADKLLRPAYKEALEETKIDPYAPADVEMVRFEIGQPLVFKAKVPLAPKVELGDYVGLHIERKVQRVTDDEVEHEVQNMLERHAEYPEVTDRPVREGDRVVISMKADNEPDEEFKRSVVDAGGNLPDFDKGLVGMSIGEEKVIDVTYPQDFGVEDMRGKTVPLRTRVDEIRQKKLPELTDEWVKETFAPETPEGEEPPADVVDTVDKLRARMRAVMEKAAQDAADAEVRAKIVEQVVSSSTVCFPEVLVSNRVAERFDDLHEELKKRQVSLEDYLDYTGYTSEELRAEYAQEARLALTTGLVLREIAKKEQIQVSEEDMQAEIRAMAEARRVPVESMKAYIDATEAEDSVESRVLHKKLVDFLVHASNIKTVSADAKAG